MRQKQQHKTTLILAFWTVTITGVYAADMTWTMHDLDTVADAATASLMEKSDKRVQALKLVKLAEALTKAGATVRAREVLIKAGSILDPSYDFMSSTVRIKIVRDLAQLGDLATAGVFANIDTTLSITMSLLAELSIARAKLGDIQGARTIANVIASLGSPTEPEFIQASGRALQGIGIALVEAGAVDDALEIAKRLPEKAAALQIVARAATTFCQASKNERGRVFAERAAGEARAIAAAADKPYLMFEPIIKAAEAVTACNGLVSAQAFVQSVIPPQTQEITRSAFIDQLISNKQVDLALAIASPPNSGDVDVCLSKREGSQGAAT